MTNEVEVVDYVRADGSAPFRRWLDRLDPQSTFRVTAAIERLRAGHESRVKWLGGIGEYRIDWGPGYRLYLAKDGERFIVLFAGGTKQRQQLDIEWARALYAEYKRRKAVRALLR